MLWSGNDGAKTQSVSTIRREYHFVPNPGAEEPLEKVTLNLNAADTAVMRKLYGHGWSAIVRELVKRHVERIHAGKIWKVTSNDPT